VSKGYLAPITASREAHLHRPTEGIWIRRAERSTRAVDFNPRDFGGPYIKTGDNGGNRTVGEVEHASDVGGDFNIDDCAIFRLAGDGALGKCDAGRT